jgi:hypothetical protein
LVALDKYVESTERLPVRSGHFVRDRRCSSLPHPDGSGVPFALGIINRFKSVCDGWLCAVVAGPAETDPTSREAQYLEFLHTARTALIPEDVREAGELVARIDSIKPEVVHDG